MHLAKHVAIILVGFMIISLTGALLDTSVVYAEYTVNPYWYRIIGGRPNNDIVVLNRIREKITPSYYSFLNIPVIHGLADTELYEQINIMFYDGITSYDDEVESNTISFLRNMGIPPEEWPHYTTEVKYKVNYNSGGILSVTVSFYHYADKIYQAQYRETVNIDLTTGRIIEFEDLFPTELERRILLKTINNQIRQNPAAYFVDEIDMSYLSKISSFYLTENRIIVYFDANDLGPYTSGTPEFVLELSKAVTELRYNSSGQ